MTLQSARRNQYLMAIVILSVFLPFGIMYLIFGFLHICCDRIMTYAHSLYSRFGHYLLLHCEEVEKGIIKNPDILEHYTASMAYRKYFNEK